MSEMQMTETAATTNEGSTSSQNPANNPSTEGAQVGNQQQATEQQTQSTDQKAGEQGQTEGNKTGGAPEAYEFKAIEGREFDPEVLTTFSDVAKELNMPQEAAQKMLDKIAPKIQERQMQQLEAVRSEWAQSSQQDKEFGGEALKENLAVAKKSLDAFGTPELRSLLEVSGLGNHPEIIRFMFKAGKAISEDRYVGSSSGSNAGKGNGVKSFSDAATGLYGP
jgi:hypothetical protein